MFRHVYMITIMVGKESDLSESECMQHDTRHSGLNVVDQSVY